MVEPTKKTEANAKGMEKVAQAPVKETPKEKTEIKSVETQKKEEKKTESNAKAGSGSKAPEKNKKTEAKVDATSLHISTKHSIAICNYVRGKNIDKAVSILEDAQAYRRAVPMRGEIPHKKGMMSGRFAIKAVTEFIKLLKSLKANAMANELELEKYVIFAKSNVASRPYRRHGQGRGKRTHVTLKLEMPKKKKAKKLRK